VEEILLAQEAIAQRAYELYLECGCSGGHDLEHWLAAERELTLDRWLAEETESERNRANHREPAPLSKAASAGAGSGVKNSKTEMDA
jgi:hypothetical protein